MTILDNLASRASRYAINLNGKVSLLADRQPITSGSFGDVYQGLMRTESTTERVHVAVKMLRGTPENEKALKAFFKEVYTWSKMSHTNILHLYGITTDLRGTLSMISPFMSNGNAQEFLRNNAQADPRPLLVDIANGLMYMHSLANSVFHGDLKGTNIMISSDGRALIGDFGFARVVESSFSMTVDDSGGTERWMSPERLFEEEPSAESDVYSFGMVVLELFTLRVPYHELRRPQVIYTVCRGEKPSRPEVAKMRQEMNDKWWNLCVRCWAFDPMDRPKIEEIKSAFDSNRAEFMLSDRVP